MKKLLLATACTLAIVATAAQARPIGPGQETFLHPASDAIQDRAANSGYDRRGPSDRMERDNMNNSNHTNWGDNSGKANEMREDRREVSDNMDEARHDMKKDMRKGERHKMRKARAHGDHMSDGTMSHDDMSNRSGR